MSDPKSYGRKPPKPIPALCESRAEYEERMVREERERSAWLKKLSAAQRNELDQIEDGTWEPDRNG